MITIQDPEVAKRLIQLIQLGVQQFSQDANQLIEAIATPFREAEAAAQAEAEAEAAAVEVAEQVAKMPTTKSKA